MASDRSAVLRTINNNTWKIHDRRMSEWTPVVGMHRKPLPMTCPREN